MRASRQNAELIRQYAESEGFSLRTAQVHRAKNDQRWVDWCRNRAAQAVVNSPGSDQRETAEKSARDLAKLAPGEWDCEEARMEWAAKNTLEKIEGMLQQATETKDVVSISTLIKSQETAAKVWQGFKKAALNARLEAGKFFDLSDLDDYKKSLMALKSVLDSMPIELGAKANPPDPEFGRMACKEWLITRFQTNLEEAKKALETLEQVT